MKNPTPKSELRVPIRTGPADVEKNPIKVRSNPILDIPTRDENTPSPSGPIRGILKNNYKPINLSAPNINRKPTGYPSRSAGKIFSNANNSSMY